MSTVDSRLARLERSKAEGIVCLVCRGRPVYDVLYPDGGHTTSTECVAPPGDPCAGCGRVPRHVTITVEYEDRVSPGTMSDVAQT